MTLKVLVVDDSAFFRSQVSQIINSHPQLSVVGIASNGREAIDQAVKLKPDVITMDYEMPVLDGISAVKEIMQRAPVPILMFSSLTYAGAKVTLDALEAGAVDFLPKFREQMSPRSQQTMALCQKILAVARSQKSSPSPMVARSTKVSLAVKPDVILIGASTGGPVALQKLLTVLPSSLPVPICLIQHMPGSFTGPFAERLNQLCRLKVVEAQDGLSIRPGCAYLAPGGQQMIFSQKGKLRVWPGDDRLNYKPSVDLTFASGIKYYPKKLLSIVLTGMGSDGTDGARLVKQGHGIVWAQDASSCVIDGMPGSIRKHGLADAVMTIPEMAELISKL